MKRLITKKRLVAAGISVAMVAAGAGAAFAYFTASGSGNATAQTGSTNTHSGTKGWTVSVTGDSTDNLFPGTAAGSGGKASLSFTITNATAGNLGLGNVDIEVAQDGSGNVLADPSNASSGVSGCQASWYDLDGTGTPSDANASATSASLTYSSNPVSPHTTLVDVASGGVVSGTATLTLVDDSTQTQDACQGVTPSIVVTAS